MFSRKADLPLQVQIPRPGDDHPSWTRVGVIAAVGFVVGIAWPRLTGVRLGPALPAEASSSLASSAAPVDSNGAVPTAAPAAAAVPVPVASAAPSAMGPPPPSVTVGHAVVFACKSADGDSLKGSDCGTLPGLEGIVMPRLRELAECPEAAGASGKLHLVTHVDFSRGSFTVDLGRASGVPSADALLGCARTAMQGARFVGIPHDNPRYSIAFTVTFATADGAAVRPAVPAASASSGATDADEGTAEVVWEVGIVRDAPKTGKVLARLPRGTSLHVGSARDGWYPVKYGDDFGNQGWLYRGAIGK